MQFPFVHSVNLSFVQSLIYAPVGVKTEGKKGEWSTRNQAVPGSSPSLSTSWICLSIVQSSRSRVCLGISVLLNPSFYLFGILI